MAASSESADLALLTGPDAGSMLATALPAWQLLSWAVHRVNHRPGAGVTVSYTVTARARGEGGRPTGQAREKYVCASTAQLSQTFTPTLVRLTHRDTAVWVWEYPHDPELPALPLAVTPSRMSAFLGEKVAVELKSYRPTRRAVVKVTTAGGGSAFAKVLRPPAAQSLAKRHRMLGQAGVLAPRVVREDPSGLVLISTLPGEPLANWLARGLGDQSVALFDTLWNLQESLPAAAIHLTHRPAWADRVGHYAHAAAVALPGIAARAHAVASGVTEMMASLDPGPIVPVHGDFYEANIFVQRGPAVGVPAPMGTAVGAPAPTGPAAPSATGWMAGVIDVDSLGPGYRADDWACLLGHMSVLPHLAPAAYPHLRSILGQWCALLEQRLPAAPVYARAAGVTLSLVAGAARTDGTRWEHDALGRLREAEYWLSRARYLAGYGGNAYPRG
ncbi:MULTISPECIES: aminoglycoside phosphotransferase family protein [Actinotignum]|uniref:Aminoglycoside phosphotransferase family protein n=1 Tax=Actinotignum timonense TaxID=1870995 RepID=A0AAW9HK02_9ACTO|nr:MULTISPECIES: aminoglycoside phosphotransferase family protein [Actinotignum]MDE1558292.1 aminoglycoside phosphotransferase family protein [Actinotignum schaalii]MDE1663752.1 aminoglycoside phosphotransferase family protein [Actinotignum schaalii]MDK6373859.1 aminoglycoside phosphotransferase family protein [Actinotignum timonense]MDK6418404.1 aminoglycoside phosphotransferase family protein [Actinotignum timonense]MDK6590908.1 aminoglycoside phosphotransferase family protein [Actinotignum 